MSWLQLRKEKVLNERRLGSKELSQTQSRGFEMFNATVKDSQKFCIAKSQESKREKKILRFLSETKMSIINKIKRFSAFSYFFISRNDSKTLKGTEVEVV